MDVKAILLIDGCMEQPEDTGARSGQLWGTPIAFLDVLGATILERTIAQLERLGVTAISVISEIPQNAFLSARSFHARLRWMHAQGPHLWRAASQVFSEHAQAGAELVLVSRVNLYAELDYEEFIQFHLDRRNHLSTVCDRLGNPIDTIVISGSRRNDANFCFRNQLYRFRSPAKPYVFNGYLKRLVSAEDCRELALDAFYEKNSIRPMGSEIKPGVWAGEGVRVHRSARLLAPAFIGAYSTVRASAVVTRGSVVEHHSEIDCGTMIENSTVLPFTYVGAGLEVAHSVVSRHCVHNIRRRVSINIHDRRLIGSVSQNAFVRSVGSVMGALMSLPKAVGGALSDRSRGAIQLPHDPAREPAEVTEIRPPATLANEDAEAQWAPVRRYGNE